MRGTRIDRQDSAYEGHRHEVVWNDLVPDRRPDEIVLPLDRADVLEAVREAIAANRRVAVKSGGHNWLGSSLRDGGVLLDMSHLNRVEVDVEARRAMFEPGATHKVLADALVPHGLAFPIGHCPTVGLGGFLLAGGAGWNMHEWGPGCWNVLGADVITAEGEEVFIDESSHPDLFWALRGASAGFPGIVTRFHVRLHDLPEIRTRRLAFPVSCLPELLPWVAERLRSSPPGIEISLIARSPQAGEDRAPRATVVATGFGASDQAATAKVEDALRGIPGAEGAVYDSGFEDLQLNDLEGEGGWTEGFRYGADTCWVSERYDEVGQVIAEAIETAPSPVSRAVLAFGFMPEQSPETAFTRFGDLTVNVYATWAKSADDRVNLDWVRRSMAPLDEFKDGHYVGETDLSVSPGRLLEAYPPQKWEKLGAVRSTYDPKSRFYGFLGEG